MRIVCLIPVLATGCRMDGNSADMAIGFGMVLVVLSIVVLSDVLYRPRNRDTPTRPVPPDYEGRPRCKECEAREPLMHDDGHQPSVEAPPEVGP